MKKWASWLWGKIWELSDAHSLFTIIVFILFIVGWLLTEILKLTNYWPSAPVSVAPKYIALSVVVLCIAASAPIYISWRLHHPKYRFQRWFGYHRTLYDLTCHLYDTFDGKKCSRYEIQMNWSFNGDQSGNIGPYNFRTCEARYTGGDGSVFAKKEDFRSELVRKGNKKKLKPVLTKTRHNYYQLEIKPPADGFKQGDKVSLRGTYRLLGQHAPNIGDLASYLENATDQSAKKMLERPILRNAISAFKVCRTIQNLLAVPNRV